MLRVAVRDVVAVLACADSETVPLPLPLAPLTTLIQLGAPETFQAQLPEVVTLTLTLPPVAGREALALERE